MFLMEIRLGANKFKTFYVFFLLFQKEPFIPTFGNDDACTVSGMFLDI